MKTITLILSILLTTLAATETKANYDPNTGRWLSRDPLGEDGGQNVYCFVENNSVNEFDPLGLTSRLTYSTVEGPTSSDCGGFLWRTKWQLKGKILKKKSKIGGIIVQHLTYVVDVKNANGQTLFTPPAPLWEAWTINAGQDVTTFIENGGTFDDGFESAGFGDGTKGSVTISGDAAFYEGQTLPSTFSVNPGLPSRDLPSTSTDPGLSGGSGGTTKTITATWDCTCSGKDKKTKVETK